MLETFKLLGHQGVHFLLPTCLRRRPPPGARISVRRLLPPRRLGDGRFALQVEHVADHVAGQTLQRGIVEQHGGIDGLADRPADAVANSTPVSESNPNSFSVRRGSGRFVSSMANTRAACCRMWVKARSSRSAGVTLLQVLPARPGASRRAEPRCAPRGPSPRSQAGSLPGGMRSKNFGQSIGSTPAWVRPRRSGAPGSAGLGRLDPATPGGRPASSLGLLEPRRHAHLGPRSPVDAQRRPLSPSGDDGPGRPERRWRPRSCLGRASPASAAADENSTNRSSGSSRVSSCRCQAPSTLDAMTRSNRSRVCSRSTPSSSTPARWKMPRSGGSRPRMSDSNAATSSRLPTSQRRTATRTPALSSSCEFAAGLLRRPGPSRPGPGAGLRGRPASGPASVPGRPGRRSPGRCRPRGARVAGRPRSP